LDNKRCVQKQVREAGEEYKGKRSNQRSGTYFAAMAYKSASLFPKLFRGNGRQGYFGSTYMYLS
jgi:hypothetical protein